MSRDFSDVVPTSIFVRSPDSIVEGRHLTRIVTQSYDEGEVERYATTDGNYTIQVMRNELQRLDDHTNNSYNSSQDTNPENLGDCIPGYTSIAGAELKVLGVVFLFCTMALAFIIYSALMSDADINRVTTNHYSTSIVVNKGTHMVSTSSATENAKK